MQQQWIYLLAGVLILAAPVGCASPAASHPPPGTPNARLAPPPDRALALATLEPVSTPERVTCCEPPREQSALASEPTEAVEWARRDLARRLGLSVDSVAVVSVLRQEFPAAAFYCRAPKAGQGADLPTDARSAGGKTGMDEPVAVVSGETILLRAAGRRYEYHASDYRVVFCRPLP